MKYRVIGANKETGEDVDVVLDAVDEAAAERIANRKGILVASATLVPDLANPAGHPAARKPVPQRIEPPVMLDENVEASGPPLPAYNAPAAPAPAYAPPPPGGVQWPAPAAAPPWPQAAAPAQAWPTVAPPPGLPTLAPRPAGSKGLPPIVKKWGIPAGCAVGGIIVLALLWVFVVKDMVMGGMGSYERYLPNNAAMVSLLDLDAARKAGSTGGAPKAFEFSKVTLDDSELVQMLKARGDEGDIVMLRTRSSQQLEYFSPQIANRKTYNGVEYGKPGGAFGPTLLAKLDGRTFVRVNGPRGEDYIKRIADGKSPSLSDDMKRGLGKVKGDMRTVATSMGPAMMGGPQLKVMWMSGSMSKDSGKAEVTMVFGSSADASKFATEMNKNRETIQSMGKMSGAKITMSNASASGDTVSYTVTAEGTGGPGGKFDAKSFLPF